MRKTLLLVAFFVLGASFVACNSYGIDGKPEVSADPQRWEVINTPSLDLDEVNEESEKVFTLMNKGVAGTLRIYSVNLLAPDGKLIKETDEETGLFTFAVSKVDSDGNVVDGEFRTAVSDSETKLNESLKGLCPLDDDGKCRDGYESLNNSFKIKALYDFDKAQNVQTSGAFYLELCTNDPSRGDSDSCTSGTSYKIEIYRRPVKPTKPRVILDCRNAFLSGTSIDGLTWVDSDTFATLSEEERTLHNTAFGQFPLLTDVTLDATNSCIPMGTDSSGNVYCGKPGTDTPANPDLYDSDLYIEYRWVQTKSPTPYSTQSHVRLSSGGDSIEGQWIEGTPVNSGDKTTFNGYTITVDNEDKNYNVELAARTVSKSTGETSDTVLTSCTPDITPNARISVELTWDKGLNYDPVSSISAVGEKIDIDLHVVRKTRTYQPTQTVDNYPDGTPGKADGYTDGYLCTNHTRIENDIKTPSHDDCSVSDQGGRTTDQKVINGWTINWSAASDIDNTWGLGPETVNIGLKETEGQGGVVQDDEYMVVVGYNSCIDMSTNASCTTEVNAKITVNVDGKLKLNGSEGVSFTLKPDDIKVIAKFKWDSAAGVDGKGDTEYVEPVTDYPACNFGEGGFMTYCATASPEVVIPIWDKTIYQKWIDSEASITCE